MFGVQPDNTVENPNCGVAAFFLVENSSTTVVAQFEWYSDIGIISYVKATGTWKNLSNQSYKGTLNPTPNGTSDKYTEETRNQGPFLTGEGLIQGIIPANNMYFTNTSGLTCLFPALGDEINI